MTRKHDQFIADEATRSRIDESAAKATRIAGLKSEIKAYDLRMDNDAKRIAELEAELDWWVELARREIKEDCPNLPAYIKKMRADLANANATFDKLRDAIKGVGQFDVTGYCHMCDEYKMHNEECPHTVSALAAGGGK